MAGVARGVRPAQNSRPAAVADKSTPEKGKASVQKPTADKAAVDKVAAGKPPQQPPATPVATDASPEQSPEPTLVLHWPAEDRGGATVAIDGRQVPLPAVGKVAYELPPRSSQYVIVLNRPGYEPIEFRFKTKAGQKIRPRKVEWQASVAAKSTAAGGVATDRQSLETALQGQPKVEPTDAAKRPPSGESQAAAEAKPAPTAPAEPDADEPILALHRKKRLLEQHEYPTLRKIFAARFEKQYDKQIKHAFGDDYQATTDWLEAHPDIKEEFYTAIDPVNDKVPAALGLFKDLIKRFPTKIPAYANLAIAIAVTWDNERRGVYDYVGHQVRTKSKLPEGRLGAIENFKYMLDAERVMQGRAQFLPWEFLILVVDHKTPLVERQWA